jgi:CubicO group peptidase (beta-lactamase class C family)
MSYRLRNIFVAFLVVIISGCDRDGPLLADVAIEEISRTLDQEVSELMRKNNVAGLSVAIIRANAVAISRSFGYADMATKRKVNELTVFKAASLGKPIFAYIVLSLAKQGAIDIDRPLYLYAGEEIVGGDPRSKTITARMVLSHTTGLPNFGKQGALNFETEPGTKFLYSGHAYEYLQRVIERITGKSLDILAQEIVFEPLSMRDSSYVWRDSFRTAISRSYDLNGKRYEVKQEAEAGNAAWSLYTTLNDYAKFVTHIMRTSKELGSVASRMLISSVHVAKGVEWGLGWGIQSTLPNPSFWHWGSIAGFRHYVVGYPDEKVGVIVLTNSEAAFKMVDSVMALSIGGSYPSYDWF